MMLPRRGFIASSFGCALAPSIYWGAKQYGHKSDLADQRKITAASVDDDLRLKEICVQADQNEREKISLDNLRSLNSVPGSQMEAKPRPLRFIEFVDVNGKVLEKIRLKTKDSPVQPKPGERFIELPGAGAYRYLFEFALRLSYFYTSYFVGSWKGEAEKKLPLEIEPGKRVEDSSFPETIEPQDLLLLAAMSAELFNFSSLEEMNLAIKQQVRSNKAISEMLKSSRMGDRNNDTLQIQLQYDSSKDQESLGRNEFMINALIAGLTGLVGTVTNRKAKKSARDAADDFVRDWQERPVFESKKR